MILSVKDDHQLVVELCSGRGAQDGAELALTYKNVIALIGGGEHCPPALCTASFPFASINTLSVKASLLQQLFALPIIQNCGWLTLHTNLVLMRLQNDYTKWLWIESAGRKVPFRVLHLATHVFCRQSFWRLVELIAKVPNFRISEIYFKIFFIYGVYFQKYFLEI